MVLTGIFLSVFGGTGIFSLIMQYKKYASNPFYIVDEEKMLMMITVEAILLAVGLVLLVLGIIKSKNKNSLDKLVNKEKNSMGMAVCPKCGLNLSGKSEKCPKCGEFIKRI